MICTCDSQPHSKEKAFEHWHDQKFSTFIHWGLYSMLGGEWNGERVTKGYSEQIRAYGNIPKEEHQQSDENVVYQPVMRYIDQEINRTLFLKINDQDTVFTLDATQPGVLPSDQANLQLDRLYRLGGFGRCSLGATHGRTSGINPIVTWYLKTIERWHNVTRWSSASIFYGDNREFTPQIKYTKKLSPISLTAGELATFTLTLSNPESIHEDLGLANFDFWLEKK
ncbi:hypothetical protein EH223_01575 [candidate division KSB1 bacterium]|nr:alpha-L-fucosidase [candidate division KSB1 bacterium]RQW06929.1 MAG: hypothetical protein EH223_01575 [candidate division KSB1 bacterium]